VIDETKDGCPKNIFVPDVVREKDMFYYKFPRLGSYLAVKLEFNSCLSESAFDAAILNYNEVDRLNIELEEERKIWIED
jgi:hypothetical protein